MPVDRSPTALNMDRLAGNFIEAVLRLVCNAKFVNGLMGVAFIL
jgi:hypothetical protein